MKGLHVSAACYWTDFEVAIQFSTDIGHGFFAQESADCVITERKRTGNFRSSSGPCGASESKNKESPGVRVYVAFKCRYTMLPSRT